MVRQAENIVAFYNKRGTCEQWIKEGKARSNGRGFHVARSPPTRSAFSSTRSPYNLGNFLRTLATPEPIKDWSLTSLKKKLIKIGAKVVSLSRYVAFQMAEVAIPRNLFAADHGTAAADGHVNRVTSLICHAFHQNPRGDVCLGDRKFAVIRLATRSRHPPKRVRNP